MTFGNRLKNFREDAGYSGEKLGELLSVSKQTISHWEKGRYEPSIAQLQRLCDIFNVTATELVQGVNKVELGAETRKFAERFDKLKPSERDKWRAMVDIVRTDETPDEKREKHERAIREHYEKIVKEDPNGVTGNTETGGLDPLAALVARHRTARAAPKKTLVRPKLPAKKADGKK